MADVGQFEISVSVSEFIFCILAKYSGKSRQREETASSWVWDKWLGGDQDSQ
jgi:hypothetical protein